MNNNGTDKSDCPHSYDKERFLLCPYCNPPKWEEICEAKITAFELMAGTVAGCFEYVTYKNRILTYRRGGHRGDPLKRRKILNRKIDAELKRLIIDCHVESRSSFEPRVLHTVGRVFPRISVDFSNGKAIRWTDAKLFECPELDSIFYIISTCLGVYFHL